VTDDYPLTTRTLIRRNAYADSVALMQVTTTLGGLPGVLDVAVVMATDLNREVLQDSGLLVGDAVLAGPNDLVMAVRASGEAEAEAALARAAAMLDARRPAPMGAFAEEPPRSLASAIRRATLRPGPNLAFISVPGPYAAGEAWQALLQGLHVFLFSDNVPLEDEVALKRFARERGLLVMGPDCGTTIVNGIGLGFTNAVRRGRVGIVGASGTGMQEVSVLLHRAGEGVSHAIGTGARDLHEEVGGITTLQALDLLREDPDTSAIVLVSKPPSATVAEQVLRAAAETGKPVVACLLGVALEPPPGVELADSLYQAALSVAAAGTLGTFLRGEWTDTPRYHQRSRLRPEQTQIRGLYCGGTLAEEAEIALRNRSRSEAQRHARDEVGKAMDKEGEHGHRFVDFGDDRFTRGRAHPMIDPALRNRAVLEAAADPHVAVLLMDVVLGHGAHPDPAGILAPILDQARMRAAADGREVAFLVHVLGTEDDPQSLARQEETLRAAGAQLFPSNYQAAKAAAMLVEQQMA
jgi:FdrA protein